ncbi:hypothetical protein CABS01_09233 [Colletotrichum abscissum]|uniref:Uncharacterized protein n=1 Tax=Colletotrichum abscissum TaxID=1671311 RepID=A0A9P9X5Y1_9PEZI|nr:uncharacterized protein CABS01_09233 [Colletotrichum abscissum]KAI3538086.1 hypothetical protein CABS02_11914 [Colletotrichum abscissum]KAK1502622.1 hypothetical protein CABS01_09233 [Colletotrichum abscissum]
MNVLAKSLDIDYLSYGALLTGLESASVHDAVAERGYDMQINFLGIPPHLGFFSQWAPSHTRRIESSMFVRWAQFFVWALSFALVCRLLGRRNELAGAAIFASFIFLQAAKIWVHMYRILETVPTDGW